jgi:hypothetical protein
VSQAGLNSIRELIRDDQNLEGFIGINSNDNQSTQLKKIVAVLKKIAASVDTAVKCTGSGAVAVKASSIHVVILQVLSHALCYRC